MAVRENRDPAAIVKQLLLAALAIAVIVAVILLGGRRSAPEVPFVRLVRETLESDLNTNGKVEPVEWASVRAERAGTVQKIDISRGQSVSKGQLLVELDSADARNALSGADARINQAQAEVQSLSAGGRLSEVTEIESGLAAALTNLATAQRESDSLERLAAKNAATAEEVNLARDTVRRYELQIASLNARRSSLVSQSDRSAAGARVQETESVAAAAKRLIALGQIRTPMTGVVYDFDLKPGAYLNPGDLVANVGRLAQVRVNVYVDEPELGRVEKEMPVVITWDAMPGRQWKGIVDRIPTEVVPLGTRQVGHVSCIIENPEQTLIPGININAQIRSKVVPHALTLPKEALRRQGSQTGVLKLEGDKVAWQPIQTGAANITRIEVKSGLNEGDAIALPVDRPLKGGDAVKPVFPQ